MIYLDTSAFLKLVLDEPRSAALHDYLGDIDAPRFVSSTLLAVEVRRGALRACVARLHRVDLMLATYDERLTRAAIAHGIPTTAPA